MQLFYPHFESNSWKIKEMIGKWSPEAAFSSAVKDLFWWLLDLKITNKIPYLLGILLFFCFYIIYTCFKSDYHKNTNITLICKES